MCDNINGQPIVCQSAVYPAIIAPCSEIGRSCDYHPMIRRLSGTSAAGLVELPVGRRRCPQSTDTRPIFSLFWWASPDHLYMLLYTHVYRLPAPIADWRGSLQIITENDIFFANNPSDRRRSLYVAYVLFIN